MAKDKNKPLTLTPVDVANFLFLKYVFSKRENLPLVNMTKIKYYYKRPDLDDDFKGNWGSSISEEATFEYFSKIFSESENELKNFFDEYFKARLQLIDVLEKYYAKAEAIVDNHQQRKNIVISDRGKL